jgi:flagellin-like hook-associated protein FlgL
MRFTIRRLVSSVTCLGFSVFLVGAALAQNDPQVGVWKLNLAKSKYSPGPAPKSGTTRIEAAGAGAKVIVDQVAGDGTARHWEFTANYDGKDSPVTGNNPDADMVARTRTNANTVQTISKKGGKVTTTQASVVSTDGKTRTVTTTGVNANGQQVNNVAVYEKQ